MDLKNSLGRAIIDERKQKLAAHETGLNVMDAKLEAEQRKLREIERLNKPFEQTKDLLTRRGHSLFSPEDSEIGSSEIAVHESFRLRSAGVEIDGQEKTARLSLIIKAKLRRPNPGYGDIPGPFSLSVRVNIADEPVTEHYLTSISKPIVRPDGVPENYGMRTYKQDGYEVQSWNPNHEEADLIARTIMEAAELERLTTPIPDEQ